MNCKTFDKLIASFIENKGDIKENKEFIKHFESCSQCRQEFESDFYAFWGLKMLSDSDVDRYNIGEEMKNTLDAARQQIKYDKFVVIGFVVIILMACMLILFLILKNENIL